MAILGFIAMLAVVYTLGGLDINIWTAAFALVFGGIWMLAIFGH